MNRTVILSLAAALLLIAPTFCHAQEPSFSKAEKYVSLDRVVIGFNEPVTEQQKTEFFEHSSWLTNHVYVNLQLPPVSIVRLSEAAHSYEELRWIMQYIRTDARVKFVNPVFRNGGDEVAVLPEIFVKVKDAVQEYLLRELSEELFFEVTGNYAYDKHVFVVVPDSLSRIYPNPLNSFELSCKLADMDMFEYVHPNFLFSPIVGTNDPFFDRQWNIVNTGSSAQGSGTPGADMSVEEAWTITRGDSSIKIAILDSGVDTLHPDLMPNLLPGYDANGGGSNGYPNKNFSSDAHGTACAGIAAAVADNGVGLTGVAPGCKIIPVKVFYYVDTARSLNFDPPIPYTTSLWIADAINWAHYTGDADVMSNSWGIPDFLFGLLQQPISLVEDAIQDAYENGRDGKGIPQLFSTGNEDDDEPIWPSRLDPVIGVTATSMCDERKSPTSCDGEDWWGGNYGFGTDVGAPGVKMYAPDILGSKGFSAGGYVGNFNGTSAACPNAAGVVALILSVRPDLHAWDAGHLLFSSADKVGGYTYNSIQWSQEIGYGRVNAFAALQLATSYTGVKNAAIPDDEFSVHPNPVSSSTFGVNANLREGAEITISLIDVNGRILERRTNPLQPGHHSILCNAPLQPGIYFLEIAANKKIHHLKLLFSGRQ